MTIATPQVGSYTVASLDRFEDDQLYELAERDPNPNRESLHISGTKISDATLIHFSNVFKYLKEVKFSYCNSLKLTMEGVKEFFQNCSQLETLTICNSFVNPEHENINIFKIIEKNYKKLKSITFQTHYADNYKKASDVFLKYLNDAEFDHEINDATLSGDHVSYIPESLKGKVRHLTLIETSIRINKISAFVAHNPIIESIGIRTLKNIPSSEIAPLYAANPNLKVTVNEKTIPRAENSAFFEKLQNFWERGIKLW